MTSSTKKILPSRQVLNEVLPNQVLPNQILPNQTKQVLKEVLSPAISKNQQPSPPVSPSLTARWKSSIPRELQSTVKTETVIRKDKMSKRSNIHQVYTVCDKNK